MMSLIAGLKRLLIVANLFSFSLLNAQGSNFIQFLVDGNNRFAFSAYEQLKKGNRNNFCFSPYSVGEGLAMVAIGCSGDTANQIQHTLNYSLSFLPLYQYLNKALISSPDQPSQIYLANGLWIDKQIPLAPPFAKVFQRNFGEPLQLLPFAQDPVASINTINRWTSEKTKGKISPILENSGVTKDTRAILTTAFYATAPWKNSFDRQTQYLSFYANSTRMIKIEMAHSIATYPVVEEGQWRLINIPFAENPGGLELTLSVFTSKEAASIDALEKMFNWNNWIKWQKNAQDKEISLTLPRFRIENTINLKDEFKKFGLTNIFMPAGDFSSLTSDKNFFINMALHKSFIRIDEKGADASGANYTLQESTVKKGQEEVSVNRPFIFVLWDRKTEVVLLLGRIVEP
jgi:serpin B